MTALTFTIDVLDTKVEDLKEALDKLEIRFKPERQLVAFCGSFMETAVAMGHHTPDLIEGVNQQLWRANLTPLVPTNKEEWNLARQLSFLEFAINCFDWIDNDLENAWWRAEGKRWEEIVKEHPLVFNGKDES